MKATKGMHKPTSNLAPPLSPTLNAVLAIPGGQQAEQRPDPHVESADLYSVVGERQSRALE